MGDEDWKALAARILRLEALNLRSAQTNRDGATGESAWDAPPKMRIPQPSTLFHPKALQQLLQPGAVSPEQLEARKQLAGWVQSLRNGTLDELNERNLQGEFLQRVFGDVLGYRVMSKFPDGWELKAERTVARSGKACDGALGFFAPQRPDRVLVAVELKGAAQSLDVAKGRERTPVEQGWEYANYTPGCRWVIVSNFRETRLYSTTRTPEMYESFLLEELEDPRAFERFYLLLGRSSLLPRSPDGKSATDELLQRSLSSQKEITDRLYAEYRGLRTMLFEDLRNLNPARNASELLAHAQTLLDRILFIAFAEDRGLLPARTIKRAFDHRDPYRPGPVWDNFQAVFKWIDEGNIHQSVPPYNGGLFKVNDRIDSLRVSDGMCGKFNELAAYNFREDVSVEVLGHIFEQSITDLEELRRSPELFGVIAPPTRSKRKDEGVFYTPAPVTRFIAEETVGKVLKEREAAAFAGKTFRGAANQIRAWEAYRDALKDLRVLDPACGSGAFLIAAFDLLAREYERVNAALADLRGGQIELFDLTKTVLNNNLFGVDLNGESVEITKLSLWLKTAQQGKQLTYLDSNIKEGNSLVEDPSLDPRAFDWSLGKAVIDRARRPDDPSVVEIERRWGLGFDVVIGNPPYVRHELFSALKPHLEEHFVTYQGMADLFVYFLERGISVLKPGGRLGFIVSNKWLKSEYAGPLRNFLATKTVLERVIDFGHAPIFPDADAFPSIVTLRRGAPTLDGEEASEFAATVFPRDELDDYTIREYVSLQSVSIAQSAIGASQWSLEPQEAQRLIDRMRERGRPLREYVGHEPFCGLKTGLNEAFVVDNLTRDKLVEEDREAAGVLRKFLRGQDVGRWTPEWGGLWMVALKSSANHQWPWSGREEGAAEVAFRAALPSLHAHLKPMEEALKSRSDRGTYWWELRSCAYYERFSAKKIVYQEIQFHPQYALDEDGAFTNNKCFFLPTNDHWLLAVLNSPLLWWFNWRYLSHMKDEALNPAAVKMAALPIADPPAGARSKAEETVAKLIDLSRRDARARNQLRNRCTDRCLRSTRSPA